jgi:TolB-like protein
MNEHTGGLKKALHLAREHLSNAVIGGTFIILTGFTPDHLVAKVLEAVHLSPETLRSISLGIDPRILLVLCGMAVIVGDHILRRRAHQPQFAGAAPGITEGGSAVVRPPLPDRPSIAVLPFQNMSGDPEQEYFADGMVEEIITALSRLRWLFVVARNSCFTYKGRAVDIKQVGVELGVRYVLEGSVRKSGTRIRITGQLIDATTGSHIWADRIDGELADVFSLQDQVTTSVVSAIAPKLEQAEIDRTKHKRTGNLDAYDYYLRGMACVYQANKESFDEALQLFQKATSADPGFATAYGMAAYCYVWRKANGWTADKQHEIAEATALARKAAELGRDDAVALCESGFAFAFMAEDLDHGAALIARATTLNPNLAAAWRFSGFTHVFLGQPEVAIEHFQLALRLSPLDPLGFIIHNGLAWAHFLSGRYEEAAAAAEKTGPNYIPGVLMRAMSLAMAGDEAESRRVLDQLRRREPAIRASHFAEWPLRRAEDRARFHEGMQKLGLPA